MSEVRAGHIPYQGVPEVTPRPAPPEFQRIQATPDEFGAEVGRGLEKVGQSLTEASNVYSEVAAQQALANWRTQTNNVLFGDPSKPGDVGYFGLQGQTAMEKRQSTRERIEEITQQTLGGLYTTRSQIVFNNEARRSLSFLDADIGRHYAQQADRWAQEVQKNQLEGASIDAALRPGDEQAANDAFSRGYQALVRGMISRGELPNDLSQASADQLQILHNNTRELANQITESRIRSSLGRGNIAEASATFEQHKDQLSSSRNFATLGATLSHHASVALGDAALQQAEMGGGGAGIARNNRLPPSAGMEGSALPAHAEAPEQLVSQIKSKERSSDEDVSPAGAIGHMQVMPATARQYGFDPARLHEHDYNEQAGRAVINDLWRRYDGDAQAVMVGYNAGPQVADRWIMSGKDPSVLPGETRRYISGTLPATQLVAGGAFPAVAGHMFEVPGGPAPTPEPSSIPQLQDLANMEMENARHYARTLTALESNSALQDDPVAYDRATRRAELNFRKKQLDITAGKQYLITSRAVAVDEVTKAIIRGPVDSSILDKIGTDPRLDGETRQNLEKFYLQHAQSGAESNTIKYGPQFDATISRMTLAPGDQNRIYDPTQLLKMVTTHDLTIQGYDKAVEMLGKAKTPEGFGDLQMVNGALDRAKRLLVFDQGPDIPIKDQKGLDRYDSGFKQAFFGHIEKGRGTEPLSKLLSDEEIDPIIAKFQRSPSEKMRDMNEAGANIKAPQPGMGGPEVPGVPYEAVWLLRQMREEHPEREGWLRDQFDQHFAPAGPHLSDKVLGPRPPQLQPQAPIAAPQAAGLAPTTPAEMPKEGPLAGEAHLLPQYDELGHIRPLGPGEYIQNPSGSWSSEMTVTVTNPDFNGGKPSVIPSLWLVNGTPQRVGERQAIAYAVLSGLVFPRFNSLEAAEKFASEREDKWEKTKAGDASVPPLWKRSVEDQR